MNNNIIRHQYVVGIVSGTVGRRVRWSRLSVCPSVCPYDSSLHHYESPCHLQCQSV